MWHRVPRKRPLVEKLCKKCLKAPQWSNRRPVVGLPGSVSKVKKVRIDAVLAEQGLFPSRTAAAGAVRAGEVRVGQDGPVALRPSQLVEPEATLVVDSVAQIDPGETQSHRSPSAAA